MHLPAAIFGFLAATPALCFVVPSHSTYPFSWSNEGKTVSVPTPTTKPGATQAFSVNRYPPEKGAKPLPSGWVTVQHTHPVPTSTDSSEPIFTTVAAGREGANGDKTVQRSTEPTPSQPIP